MMGVTGDSGQRTADGGPRTVGTTGDRGPETGGQQSTVNGEQITENEGESAIRNPQSAINESEIRNPKSEIEQSEIKRVLIVGLGNPGREHREDRHNIGFMVIDRLAEQYQIPLGRVQMRAIVGNGSIAGRPVILAKPQTYMNRSGDAAGPLARYYKIEPPQLLVVYDELDLPFGTLRLRKKGGAGGHNGMRSVIQHMGPDFPRLRLGIGRPPGRMPPAAHVLQRFSKDELPVLENLLDEAVQAIESFLNAGIDLAMTRHNGSVAEA